MYRIKIKIKKIKKIEFRSMGLLIFAFDFELWQILFSHTLLWGNLNNAVLTSRESGSRIPVGAPFFFSSPGTFTHAV